MILLLRELLCLALLGIPLDALVTAPDARMQILQSKLCQVLLLKKANFRNLNSNLDQQQRRTRGRMRRSCS